MIKIATPISHLFENKDYTKKILSFSDCLECRDFSINATLAKQEVFHCDLQPIHKLTETNINYLKYIRNTKKDLKLITFHITSCCDNPYIKNWMFQVRGKEYTEKEMLINARKNLLIIKEIFGENVKMAIENNNYYPTDAYKFVTEHGFISQIVYENNIYFLFDIAHANITSNNKKMEYNKYKNMLPLDRTIQLHICSYEIGENDLAYDVHNYPSEKEFAEVKDFLNKFELQYLTVEYYKDVDYLINSLKRLKELL